MQADCDSFVKSLWSFPGGAPCAGRFRRRRWSGGLILTAYDFHLPAALKVCLDERGSAYNYGYYGRIRDCFSRAACGVLREQSSGGSLNVCGGDGS